jgi:hypothetical protein
MTDEIRKLSSFDEMKGKTIVSFATYESEDCSWLVIKFTDNTQISIKSEVKQTYHHFGGLLGGWMRKALAGVG